MRVWVFIREKPLEAYELVSFNLRLHDLFKKKFIHCQKEVTSLLVDWSVQSHCCSPLQIFSFFLLVVENTFFMFLIFFF